jgi:histidinol-phosphate/aromatic aminotransferase/cobyric acid decarboxylase-like protein
MIDARALRHHGGTARLWGPRGTDLVDMSTCVDAFGLLEPVRRALEAVETDRSYRHYPDPESREARRILARCAATSPDRIDLAPGAADIIWTSVRALLGRADRALAWAPCFSEFEYAVRAVGAEFAVHEYGSGETIAEVQRFAQAVHRAQPKVAYLCAPTCPRGQWIPAQSLKELAADAPATVFLVDQSYLNLSHHAQELAVAFPRNVVLIRSVTKELGLPGIRVGYAVLDPELRRKFDAQRPHWSLGVHAQAVLEVYADCLPLLTERRQLLLRRAAELSDILTRSGGASELQDAHYFTVKVPAAVAADRWSAQLYEAGVAVRDCTSFGLTDRLRVVAHPEQAKLATAWSNLMRSRGPTL